MCKISNSNLAFLKKIREDFAKFDFVASEEFRWNFETKTIFFEESAADFESLLLHELGHALCEHADFELDIELVRIEAEAWQKAREVSKKYNVKINDDLVESHLDTYRDWLHKRSLCPNCLINGFQQSGLNYRCVACETVWWANDSRFKSLRRRKK